MGGLKIFLNNYTTSITFNCQKTNEREEFVDEIFDLRDIMKQADDTYIYDCFDKGLSNGDFACITVLSCLKFYKQRGIKRLLIQSLANMNEAEYARNIYTKGRELTFDKDYKKDKDPLYDELIDIVRKRYE